MSDLSIFQHRVTISVTADIVDLATRNPRRPFPMGKILDDFLASGT